MVAARQKDVQICNSKPPSNALCGRAPIQTLPFVAMAIRDIPTEQWQYSASENEIPSAKKIKNNTTNNESKLQQ